MKKLIFSCLLAAGWLAACQPTRTSQSTSDFPEVHIPNAILCRAEPTDKAWYTSGKKATLFEGLGDLHHPVTTRSPEAQRYFDQGLMLAYGFNHAEAARSFFEATRLDSACAMAHWGFAYVLGPNYNAGMEKDNYERAYTAIQKALRYADRVTPKERALIQAMAKRYPAVPVDERRPYDIAYSKAMKSVHDRFPDDADIAAIYAESLMDLHPWDLWEKNGQPKPWTPEIVATLEGLLKRFPEHIGTHHFYIHAVEASRNPQRGLKSAELVGRLAPNASHLVHMPSHIYIRTGHYHEGSVANQRAVEVDKKYLLDNHAEGSFVLTLHPHNYHFLAATATMEGNSQVALDAAWKVNENTRRKLLNEPGWSTLQHYYSIPYYVAVKFSRWGDILRWSEADTLRLAYPKAVRHYARGMAYTGMGQLDKARTELQQLDRLAADPGLKKVTIWDLNDASSLFEIGRRVLRAEIMAKENKSSESIRLLREAIAIEDRLNYNEPPDWFFSVRHHLGAIQLKAKQWADAERTYAEDLREFPNNGWALAGLAKARLEQGKTAEAQKTLAQAQQAWKWADGPLRNSLVNLD